MLLRESVSSEQFAYYPDPVFYAVYPAHDVTATQATPSKVHLQLYALHVNKLYPVEISPHSGSLQFEVPAVVEAHQPVFVLLLSLEQRA